MRSIMNPHDFIADGIALADVSPFPSKLGWMALVVSDGKLRRIKFGFGSELKLLRSIEEDFDNSRQDKIVGNGRNQILTA